MITLNTDNSVNSPDHGRAATSLNASGGLGQADFIQLMLTQMENQDPTKPLDPNQFMSQLAQFSTVNGIQSLQQSFDALADKLSSSQTLQAAGLVGRDVIVPGGDGSLVDGGRLDGNVVIPAHASEVTVNIYNSHGVLVRSLSLGEQSAGNAGFQWDGVANDGTTSPSGSYRFTAEALINGSSQALETTTQSRIESVTVNQDGSGTRLNLVGGGSVPLSTVQQIM